MSYEKNTHNDDINIININYWKIENVEEYIYIGITSIDDTWWFPVWVYIFYTRLISYEFYDNSLCTYTYVPVKIGSSHVDSLLYQESVVYALN